LDEFIERVKSEKGDSFYIDICELAVRKFKALEVNKEKEGESE